MQWLLDWQHVYGNECVCYSRIIAPFMIFIDRRDNGSSHIIAHAHTEVRVSAQHYMYCNIVIARNDNMKIYI